MLIDWFRPARQNRLIRRDFAKFANGAPRREQLLKLSRGWSSFEKPVLIVWAANDLLMPADHGQRLAELYPNASLTVFDHCSTLVGEDQPERFASLVADFVRQ